MTVDEALAWADKKCSKCGAVKGLDEFHADKRRLRAAIQTVLDSPGYMVNDDIEVLVKAVRDKP